MTIKDELKLFSCIDRLGGTDIHTFAAEEASPNIIFYLRLPSLTSDLDGISGTYADAEETADTFINIPGDFSPNSLSGLFTFIGKSESHRFLLETSK